MRNNMQNLSGTLKKYDISTTYELTGSSRSLVVSEKVPKSFINQKRHGLTSFVTRTRQFRLHSAHQPVSQLVLKLKNGPSKT